jgi:transketolase
MAAAMNGIALHGFLIPYGGTFLVFSDYCRPSIRLSALMRKRVIYVFTHDSIGLGEDGPTHQPIEHLSSLRDIPNLKVFRPCDSIETAECWALALANEDGPSVLALSRQNLKLLRNEKFNNEENYSKNGAYIIVDFETPDINIVASGSEVEIAVEASKKLNEKNVKARVISIPCMELFNENNMEYRKRIFSDTKNIFIEAGTIQSWAQYMDSGDVFIGLKSFGLSGPAKDVYEHFQITVDRVLREVTKVLNI